MLAEEANPDAPSEVIYWCWLLCGPECPPQGRSGPWGDSLRTLPEAISSLALRSQSYWWMESSVTARRQTLYKISSTVEGVEQVCAGDDGAELNLRSRLANSLGLQFHAFDLGKLPFQSTNPYYVTGLGSTFHVRVTGIAENPSLAGLPPDIVDDPLLFEALTQHVVSLSRVAVVPMGARRSFLTETDATDHDTNIPETLDASEDGPKHSTGNPPSSRTDADAKAFAAVAVDVRLLPGIALISGSEQELQAALDVFTSQIGKHNVKRTTVHDDFLLTQPHRLPPRGSFFDYANLRMRNWFRDILWNQLPADDVSPLWRLVLTCDVPAIRDFLIEGGGILLHPLDSTAQTLSLSPANPSTVSSFREWVLFTARLASSDWKATVVDRQRLALQAAIEQAGGFKHIWRDGLSMNPGYLGGLNTAESSFKHDFGGIIPVSPPDRSEANLDRWTDWLKQMPIVERRWGFELLIAFLTLVQRCAEQDPRGHEATATVASVLGDHVDKVRDNKFQFSQDQVFLDLGRRLLGPALDCCAAVLKWSPIQSLNVIQTLIAQLVDANECVPDWLAAGTASREQLRNLLINVPALEYVSHAYTSIRHRADGPLGMLMCLMIPPRRLWPGHFQLGETSLGDPLYRSQT